MAVLKDRPRWRGDRSRRGGEKSDHAAPPKPIAEAEPKRRARYGRRILTKARGKEWHSYYRLSVEASLIVSLAILVGLIRAPLHSSEKGFEVTLGQQEIVEMEEIQQTKQALKPPPPPRPPVPVEVSDDTILDDDELDLDVTLDMDEAPAYIPPPPAPSEKERDDGEDMAEIFVVVEQMPEIIGGHNKIYEYLEYPTIARQAQMEGLVVVQVVVEPDGSGTNAIIAKSAGKVLDEAALEAVKKLRYKPGMQRGRAVRVKMAIPIRFMLKGRS